MKVVIKSLSAFVLLSIVALMGACTNPTHDGTPAEPITLYEKIVGDWNSIDVVQIDETAKRAGITPTEISLYDQFEFAGFGISFALDGAQQPTTYTVTGQAPALFPTTGWWDLSSPFLPTDGSSPVIRLYSDASRGEMTARLVMMAVPGAEAAMELGLTHSTGGVPYVTYSYKLRANTPIVPAEN